MHETLILPGTSRCEPAMVAEVALNKPPEVLGWGCQTSCIRMLLNQLVQGKICASYHWPLFTFR
jgi:hypothetical protein